MGQKAIDREYKNVLKAAESIETGGTREFIESVNRLRREIVLAVSENGKITESTVTVLRQKMDRIVYEYETKFKQELSDNQRRMFVKGIQTIDRSLASGDLRVAIPYLSEQVLNNSKELGAELVTNITADIRAKLNQEVLLSAMGQKSVEETIQSIGRNLTDPSIFSSISKRAETIFATELNRIYNISTVERLDQASQSVGDLMKTWQHSNVGTPRPGHYALNDVTIPIGEKFVLVGADGEEYEVDGPMDPILPAGEVVGCKCRIKPSVGRFNKQEEPIGQVSFYEEVNSASTEWGMLTPAGTNLKKSFESQ